MTDAMNLDPSDLVAAGLEEFETLENIQAELDRLEEERNHEGKVIISGSRNRVVMTDVPPGKDTMKIPKEELIEKMEEDMVEETEETICDSDDVGVEGEVQEAKKRRYTVFTPGGQHQEHHALFSESGVGGMVLAEEEVVIKDERIMEHSGDDREEGATDLDDELSTNVVVSQEPSIYDDVETMSQVDPLELETADQEEEEEEDAVVDRMEEVTSDNVLAEETVIGDEENEDTVISECDTISGGSVTAQQPQTVTSLSLPTGGDTFIATKGTVITTAGSNKSVIGNVSSTPTTTLILKTESISPGSGGTGPTLVHHQPQHQQIAVLNSNIITAGKLTAAAPSGGVYVVTSSGNNFIGAQSLLQGGTILSHKDNNKMAQITGSGVGSTVGGSVSGAQTIRIIGSQGKILGSPAKTITLAQAKQMGLITPANHLLPAGVTTSKGGTGGGKVLMSGTGATSGGIGSGGTTGTKKTVTVVKSPTKILPAPAPTATASQQAPKTQKLLIRQVNTLKTGTILTSSGGSGGTGGGVGNASTPTTHQVIRIPTTQAITANLHQIHLPGKQVQYLKLVGSGSGSKGQQGSGSGSGGSSGGAATTTFLPMSALAKSIPVALPTSILNSSQQGAPTPTTAFKVVPLQQQAQNTSGGGGGGTVTTQRVLIPASMVQASGAARSSTTTQVGTNSTSSGTTNSAANNSGATTNSSGTTVSNIVMLPSHLIHQVKKLGVLQESKVTVGSGLRATGSPAGTVVSAGNNAPVGTIVTSNPRRIHASVSAIPPISSSTKLKDVSGTGVQQVIVKNSTGTTTASGTSSGSVGQGSGSGVMAGQQQQPAVLVSSGSAGILKIDQQQSVVVTTTNSNSSSSAAILSNSSSNSGAGILKSENSWNSMSADEPMMNTLEANGIRPRKPCNCTKSMCLKLYCDCFANGEFCHQCNCTCCYNNLEHEEERQRAIKSCLERNPTAFRPKIGKTFVGSDERRHNKGCNCRRSGCLKNYCECYEAKIPCSKNCKCVGCKNLETYPGRRGGSGVGAEMVNAGLGTGVGSGLDDRVGSLPPGALPSPASSASSLLLLSGSAASPAPNSPRIKLNAHHLHLNRANSDNFLGQRQAFRLLNTDVVQATCQCMLAQAEDWEKTNSNKGAGSDGAGSTPLDVAQSLIIQEFGKCVIQIIDRVTQAHHHNHHHNQHHHNHHQHHSSSTTTMS